VFVELEKLGVVDGIFIAHVLEVAPGGANVFHDECVTSVEHLAVVGGQRVVGRVGPYGNREKY
jgi:hypothetical protein